MNNSSFLYEEASIEIPIEWGLYSFQVRRSQNKFVNLRLLKSYQAYFDYNVVRLEFNYKEKITKKTQTHES